MEKAEMKYIMQQIEDLIKDCEEIQQSNESEYSKEKEKVLVYEKIRDLVEGR